MLTVKDAVTHIVRSTRHSRANSSDRLDQLDPEEASPKDQSDSQAEPQTDADSLASVRGVTFSDAGHISLSGASSLPPVATRQPPGNSREANETNGAITERSESSEAWSEERIRQLEDDKAAIERLWGEHAQENDIGVLKFKLVSLLPPGSLCCLSNSAHLHCSETLVSCWYLASSHTCCRLPGPAAYGTACHPSCSSVVQVLCKQLVGL